MKLLAMLYKLNLTGWLNWWSKSLTGQFILFYFLLQENIFIPTLDAYSPTKILINT